MGGVRSPREYVAGKGWRVANNLELEGQMDFTILAILFLIDLAAATAFLWVGMKVASVVAGMPGGGQYCSYMDSVMVALASSLAALVPIRRLGAVLHRYVLHASARN